MSVRNLAAAGLAVYAVGGPLLLLDLPSGSLGLPGQVGAIGVWLGVGLVLTALLGVARAQQKMLRAQAERIRGLAAGSDAARGSGAAGEAMPLAALRDEVTRLQRHIDERLDVHQRGLLQVVDARILGIHETVRDLASSESDGAA